MPVLKLNQGFISDDGQQVLLEMQNVTFFSTATQSEGVGRLRITDKSVARM
jgi:hypothetical protein